MHFYLRPSRLFSALLLGVALLAAPCSVRNLVQGAMDMQQTEVLNKSKSSYQGTCTPLQASVWHRTVVAPKAEAVVPAFPGTEACPRVLLPLLSPKNPSQTARGAGIAAKVPRYLLYQKMKYLA